MAGNTLKRGANAEPTDSVEKYYEIMVLLTSPAILRAIKKIGALGKQNALEIGCGNVVHTSHSTVNPKAASLRGVIF